MSIFSRLAGGDAGPGSAYGPAACLVLGELLRLLKTKGILTDPEIEALLQPAQAELAIFGADVESEAGDVIAMIRDGAEMK